jgi:hypothetical protein
MVAPRKPQVDCGGWLRYRRQDASAVDRMVIVF